MYFVMNSYTEILKPVFVYMLGKHTFLSYSVSLSILLLSVRHSSFIWYKLKNQGDDCLIYR